MIKKRWKAHLLPLHEPCAVFSGYLQFDDVMFLHTHVRRLFTVPASQCTTETQRCTHKKLNVVNMSVRPQGNRSEPSGKTVESRLVK